MAQQAFHGRMPIDSETQLIALLGYPVKHSASPQFQNAAIEALGLNALYMAFCVPPAEFARAFAGLSALGALGANLTVPHKETAFALCDERAPEARVIEAVNTIRFRNGRSVGYNTDAYGVAAALQEEGVRFHKARVVVLGAGGAARAIVAQAILDGAAEVIVVNRTTARAEALLARLLDNCRKLEVHDQPHPYPRCKVIGYDDIRNALVEADILINATSVGLNDGDPPLFDPMFIHAQTFVYDTIYNPPQTRLLIDAKQSGCRRTANGLNMLLHQGARAFELWFDRPAPIELMRKNLMQPRTTLRLRKSP